jgi:regulator of sigma E protease
VKWGETEYAIGALPFGGYVKITGMTPREVVPPEVAHRAYYRQPVWKRVVVIAAGPAMNVLLALGILWAFFLAYGAPEITPRIDRIDHGQPASKVLRVGDFIVAADGRHGGVDAIARQIASHHCVGSPRQGCPAKTPVRLTVRRHGSLRTFVITPRYDVNNRRTRLGFAFTRPKVGVWRAAEYSTERNWQLAKATVRAIVRIFYSAQARREVSGVVGSYEVTRRSFEFDVAQALMVLGIISLSLAIVNLFPFLPLDGGHIFWAVAEKIRGRPIPFSVLERMSFIGFALVIFLFVVGLTNDIGRLRGEGFGVR